LDKEFFALAIIFLFIGATGVLLFAGPPTPSGDSCYCIIPSPEAGAMQGTSGILLIFGVLFLPVGLLKGGLPSFRRRPSVEKPQAGKVFTPVPFTSPRLFALGVLVLFLGVDAIVIPAVFLVRSPILILVGAFLCGVGSYFVYRGTRLTSG
jgi:hypothetical protein